VAYNLFETTITVLQSELKAKLPAALASVRVNRGDAQVTTEPPFNYFITEQASGYRAPSVFIIADGADFNLANKGANHINATVRVNVAVVVEDRDTFRLTTKAWRYQAALHEVLAQDGLTSGDGAVTLKVKVASASFSTVYSNAQKAGNDQGTYRKEVVLHLEVDHYEQL
jgi:hypothetical protein